MNIKVPVPQSLDEAKSIIRALANEVDRRAEAVLIEAKETLPFENGRKGIAYSIQVTIRGRLYEFRGAVATVAPKVTDGYEVFTVDNRLHYVAERKRNERTRTRTDRNRGP